MIYDIGSIQIGAYSGIWMHHTKNNYKTLCEVSWEWLGTKHIPQNWTRRCRHGYLARCTGDPLEFDFS